MESRVKYNGIHISIVVVVVFDVSFYLICLMKLNTIQTKGDPDGKQKYTHTHT